MWNLRMYARGRPQSGQRFLWRTAYLGLRVAATIFEVFAIVDS